MRTLEHFHCKHTWYIYIYIHIELQHFKSTFEFLAKIWNKTNEYFAPKNYEKCCTWNSVGHKYR